MSTRRKVGPALLVAFLAAIAVVYLYPVVFTLLTSVKSTNEFHINLWGLPKKWMLDNYVNAFTTGRLGDYFGNSVFIAACSLLLVTLLGTFAGYALSRLHLRWTALIVGILFVLQILPAESMIIPLYLMASRSGLTQLPYAPLIVVYVGWMLSGTILILRNFFQSISTEILESARIDGCSDVDTMFRIIFPLSGGAVATCTVFNFGFVWGELMWAKIATLTTQRGIPLSVGLMNFQGQFTTDWGQLTAAISMVLLPMILLYVFLQKYFVRGLTSGALKG
jgi:ABC-type glycerol-3-phosphate transport system permease component